MSIKVSNGGIGKSPAVDKINSKKQTSMDDSIIHEMENSVIIKSTNVYEKININFTCIAAAISKTISARELY